MPGDGEETVKQIGRYLTMACFGLTVFVLSIWAGSPWWGVILHLCAYGFALCSAYSAGRLRILRDVFAPQEDR